MATGTLERAAVGRGGRVAPIALGVFSVLHGIAHFAGTAGHLEKIDEGTAESYLGGTVEISDPSVLRSLAVIWAVVGVTYIVVGVLVMLRHPVARGAFVAVTCVSLVLSLLALWAAVIGVIVNVVLLTLVWKASPRLFPARA
jgi:hypothetical protein